jgi:hypothetical protein
MMKLTAYVMAVLLGAIFALGCAPQMVKPSEPVELIPVQNVKGTGLDRGAALDAAKRNAVEQALGVALESETEVLNSRLVKDAIRTRASGYISKYEVRHEGQVRGIYEVLIDALVTRSSLKADARALQSALGGFRFMTWYDFRKLNPGEVEDYEFAARRVNEKLSKLGFRYVDPGMFRQLADEARQLFPDTTKPLTVAQSMGVWARVPVFIELAKLTVTRRPLGMNLTGASAMADAGAYDTYTAEGLGVKVERSDSDAAGPTPVEAGQLAIEPVVARATDSVVAQMLPKLADWVLNGKAYVVRFYGAGSYKDLRPLKDRLKQDSRFGGEMEIVSAPGYAQFDLTFRGAADALADATLDYAGKTPGLEALDVDGFFKNQVNFVLPGAKVPEAERGIPAGRVK